jgi:bifunctional enzyme CysN/CysC
MVRELFDQDEFIEIFVDTPIEECVRRDPKGLYAKAMSGAIKNFTGVSSPYEPPENPELRINTVSGSPEQTAQIVLSHLRGLMRAG